jgi:hypothetical protein
MLVALLFLGLFLILTSATDSTQQVLQESSIFRQKEQGFMKIHGDKATT